MEAGGGGGLSGGIKEAFSVQRSAFSVQEELKALSVEKELGGLSVKEELRAFLARSKILEGGNTQWLFLNAQRSTLFLGLGVFFSVFAAVSGLYYYAVKYVEAFYFYGFVEVIQGL